MLHNNLSLGSSVAVLEYSVNNQEKSEQLLQDHEHTDIYAQVIEEYNEIKSGREKKIYRIPGMACFSDAPFLKGNIPFFISHFIFNKNGDKNVQENEELASHLNSCYWCFREYSDFFKDYYQTTQQLKNHCGGE